MSSNNKIVSIVEDELDITYLFHDALSKAVFGVSFIGFSDSFLALEHFKNNKQSYQLVIADWGMPKLDGLELLNRIKKINPNVRSILTSAYEVENEPLFQMYMEEGIIDKFIQKPMTMNYLCREVSNQVQVLNCR